MNFHWTATGVKVISVYCYVYSIKVCVSRRKQVIDNTLKMHLHIFVNPPTITKPL